MEPFPDKSTQKSGQLPTIGGHSASLDELLSATPINTRKTIKNTTAIIKTVF
jgi:hypothetical protein